MSDTSRELLAAFREGSEAAADRIFERYVMRLTALARVRLSEKIARRIDVEDVVLSAYRSFFVAARNGRFELQNSGDLWSLLVSITLHKLHRQVTAHNSQKRTVTQEAPPESIDRLISRDPTPEQILAASEELEAILKELDPIARRVLELRLQGETLQSIAQEIARNERTVRRILDEIRTVFQRRLQLDSGEALRLEVSAQASERPLKASRPRASARPISSVQVPVDLKSVLYKDYLLERFVGSGGSGKVYRAKERCSGRNVAVKFLRKAFQNEPNSVQRFIDEAAVVSRMDHPGIAKLHGLGQLSNGGYFMVTDWFAWGDLNRYVQSGSVTVSQAVRWVLEASLAMDYVHQHGQLHCDLKPSNLLLSEQGRIVVTDFGLARTISQDRPLSVEGTAGYMAPEQAIPGIFDLGPWTDIFGLGAVLYALLAGHSPYVGSRSSDILAKLISNHPIERLCRIRTDVPAQLEELCLRCLERDPSSRIASAAELAKQLRQIEADPTQMPTLGDERVEEDSGGAIGAR